MNAKKIRPYKDKLNTIGEYLGPVIGITFSFAVVLGGVYFGAKVFFGVSQEKDEYYELVKAAGKGDLLDVSTILDKSNDALYLANIRGSGGAVLHYAAYNGHFDVVKRLVERGAYVDTRINIKDRGLLGNMKHSSVDDQIRFAAGVSPLVLAVYKNHVEVVIYLLEMGADPDSFFTVGMDFSGKNLRTATMLAENQGNMGIVSILDVYREKINNKVSDQQVYDRDVSLNGLFLNGTYQTNDGSWFLRFFEDGTIISTSKYSSSFDYGFRDRRGKYRVNGSAINFEIFYSDGYTVYSGTIDENGRVLNLNFHNTYNGVKGQKRFEFSRLRDKD